MNSENIRVVSKLMIGCFTITLLCSGCSFLVKGKYLVKDGDKQQLKKIRTYGYIMFIGSAVMIILELLTYR